MPTNTFNISTDLKVSGNTLIVGGLTANSLSATTFLGDVVTSVSAGTGISITQTTGAVTINATGGGSFTGGTVTGPTSFTGGLSANTISATTYQNLPTTNQYIIVAGTGSPMVPSSGQLILNPSEGEVFEIYISKTTYDGINNSSVIEGIKNSILVFNNSLFYSIYTLSFVSDFATYVRFGATLTGGDDYFTTNGQIAGATFISFGTVNTLTTVGTSGAATLVGNTLNIPQYGGGGSTPGGNINEVQYNGGSGSFSGAANVEIDSGNLKLVSTTDPSAPTGGIISYSKSIAGRHLPKIIGPSGIDTVMQIGLHGNSVMMVAPANTTTAPNTWGGVLTTIATISHQQTIASANPWQATRRTRFQTSTTAGNTSGMRTGYVQWFRGSVAGFGGFWFRCQLGMNINLNGGQKFVGLCALTTALAGEPSALLNMCGMGYDSTDLSTGNWQFMYNDGTGTATKVDLGVNAARNTLHGYDLIMYMAPGGSELFVRIINLGTNTTVLDTSYTTLLPTANTGMAFKAEVRNGAVAAADNLEIAKVYIESDY